MGTRRVRFCAAAVLVAAFGFGCGDDGGADSAIDAAPPDADLPDAGFNAAACPTSYGPAGVSESFVIAEATAGFDLDGAADPDGDGMVDNQLGSNTSLRGLINNALGGGVEDGSLRNVNELRDLTDLAADDSSITVVIYGGIDDDDPGDLSDDFAGDETYYFDRRWVGGGDCAPLASASGDYTGGVITASNPDNTFFIEALGGFVDFKRSQISATVEADVAGFQTPAGMTLLFGGAIPVCSLSTAPGQVSGSALEDIARIFSVQPDIDLDGDGIETIQAEPGDGVVSCTDGDSTVITGQDCACDPRIADGYSIAFDIVVAGASVLGPAPE